MLLFKRSIVIEVCLVLIAGHLASSAEDDYSDEYHSEYSDDHYHPDYTKYFGGVASASAAVANKQSPEQGFTSGFVAPAEFQSFWNIPINFDDPNPKETVPKPFVAQPAQKADPFEALKQSFNKKEAASETNPLKKDYFEESQTRQKSEESEEVKPGPYYVSHKIPGPQVYETNEERAQSKDDVETIRPPTKGKNKKKPKVGSDYDDYKDNYDAFETTRKAEEQVDQTKIDPATYYGKNVDYNTGKSSSTVSQYPGASGYLAQLQIPTTTINPYQKYSYQPLQSKYLETLTDAPAKKSDDANDDGAVSPSETAAENVKNKNCRKINGPENAEGMNCFVCENAASKGKYTQCSYTSSQEPVNQYAGSSIRYSTPVKAPETLRFKRSPRKSKYDHDPYHEVSQRSREYFADFEKEQEAAESERNKDFHYKPYDPEGYEESYSASQSSELRKKPGACTEVQREGGETCTVCKDESTGGNFEQCSYTSAPKESKYAYVAEKKYDSEQDQPEETKTVTKQSSEPLKVSATKSKIVVKDPIPELSAAGTTIDETAAEADEEQDDEAEEESESNDKKESDDDDTPSYYNYGGELKKDKELVKDDPYDVPEHFAATVTDKATAEEEDGNDEQESFDEYHYKLFPELNKGEDGEESKQEEQKTDATEKKEHDVEEVLLEFAKKDRANCKKAQKNGMTCFLCVDANKVQHEECMYVAESKPKPTHIAYHEVQRLKDPKGEHQPLVNQESDTEESKRVETPISLTKKKKFFKKVPQAGAELIAAASDVHRTVVPYEKQKKRFLKTTVRDSKASGSAPDSERLEESESKDDKEETKEEPETPAEVDVGDEEGAYSHETKPVYSKLFGTTLPKYMVDKTEFEKEFDAASGFD